VIENGLRHRSSMARVVFSSARFGGNPNRPYLRYVCLCDEFAKLLGVQALVRYVVTLPVTNIIIFRGKMDSHLWSTPESTGKD
jgi:hypothetical protein